MPPVNQFTSYRIATSQGCGLSGSAALPASVTEMSNLLGSRTRVFNDAYSYLTAPHFGLCNQPRMPRAKHCPNCPPLALSRFQIQCFGTYGSLLSLCLYI